ncbi:proteoglycan 4-like isoform X2 [Periplaneta americana]|uniref:proteoglycan 4-like isoform X2 n=1 Tax=Periplaneta americana TaxID=6978 RepID=UPI0037E77870
MVTMGAALQWNRLLVQTLLLALLCAPCRAQEASPSYDQCSHPFHSFLCNSAPRPRTVTPVGAASFNVKQVASPPVAAPSFGVKTVAAPPDPPKQKPAEGTAEEPSTVNCQQHETVVKAPSTPKTVVIVGESSFARESKLPPEPYLPPYESPAPSFQQPVNLFPPIEAPRSPDKPLPSATFVDVVKVAPQTKSTSPPLNIIPRFQPLEGQAANSPVRTAPQEDDNCKHAFHSFLCNPSSGRKTPKPSPTSPLRGDSSFVSSSKVPPPSPPVPLPSNTNFVAAKPFEYRPTSTTPKPFTTTRPPMPVPEQSILTGAAQTSVEVTALNQKQEPSICKDAFHSFLCQPVQTSRRRQKYGERYQSGSAQTSPPPSPLRGESSFVQQSRILPNFNQPASTAKPFNPFPSFIQPSTTVKPFNSFPRFNQPVTTVKPASHFPSFNQPFTTKKPANVFPSFNQPTTTQKPLVTPAATSISIRTEPPCIHTKPPLSSTYKPPVFIFNTTPQNIISRADSSFNQPSRLPFPISTTAKPPAFRKPDLPVGAAQTPDVTIVRPEHSHDHDHGHDHHGIDICKDPFHSFLCTPVVPSKRKRPTGDLPAKFKNQNSPSLSGASSFNQPTKVHFDDVSSRTTRPPPPTIPPRTTTTTPKSVPPRKEPCIHKQNDIQPQAAQTNPVKIIPQAAQQVQFKTEDPCKHSFHSFLCNKKETIKPLSTTVAPFQLRGDSSFQSATKVPPPSKLIAQSTQNQPSNQGYVYPKPSENQPTISTTQHPGYVYNKPSKPLQYPIAAGSSTDPRKTASPSTLIAQGAQNVPSTGYVYNKPDNPLQFTTTTIRTTVGDVSGEGSGSSQGYNYPRPPPGQQFTTPQSGYKYTAPPRPLQNPFLPSLVGAGSNNDLRITPPRGGDEAVTPCEHTRTTPRSLPSPAEFVRGPTGQASVRAASNEVPDKCNHPFLGYVCKRSSDSHVNKNK